MIVRLSIATQHYYYITVLVLFSFALCCNTILRQSYVMTIMISKKVNYGVLSSVVVIYISETDDIP